MALSGEPRLLMGEGVTLRLAALTKYRGYRRNWPERTAIDDDLDAAMDARIAGRDEDADRILRDLCGSEANWVHIDFRDLMLSSRTVNATSNWGVETLGAIVGKLRAPGFTKAKWPKNFGKKSMDELLARLAAVGIDARKIESEKTKARQLAQLEAIETCRRRQALRDEERLAEQARVVRLTEAANRIGIEVSVVPYESNHRRRVLAQAMVHTTSTVTTRADTDDEVCAYLGTLHPEIAELWKREMASHKGPFTLTCSTGNAEGYQPRAPGFLLYARMDNDVEQRTWYLFSTGTGPRWIAYAGGEAGVANSIINVESDMVIG